MVLSTIQSPRRSTWTTRRVSNPKYFILLGVDWCVATVNSSLTRRRIPKALLPFFCPTKLPMRALANPCMASMQESHRSPHQINFDTDSQKFLIDSGVSAHLWNCCKDFISYRALSPQERKNNQVLGVSGEAVAPQGIGSIRLKIEDDLNDIHTIHLHDVRYLLEAPINIVVPQVFSQQCQAEGDSKASCSISADAISLQWMGENGKMANKYVPLNKSNVGICFTASGYKQFRAFTTLCGMPATFILDDEMDVPIKSPVEGPIMVTPSNAPTDQPQCSESEGVTTDFMVNPTLIPSDDQDEPLLKSNQAALMQLHEQLRYCSFAQLKQMAEQSIIPKNSPRFLHLNVQAVSMERLTGSHGGHTKLIQKSNRQPYQELWSASTSSNPLFQGSCLLQKHNLQSKSIAVLQCLWTMQATSLTSNALPPNNGRNDRRETRVRTPGGATWGANPSLPLRQWKVHRQSICGRRLDSTSNNHLLWRRCTPPKRGGRKMHSRHHRKRSHPPSACSPSMAQSRSCQPMATNHERAQLPRPGKTESPLSKFAATSIQPNLKHFHPFRCLVYVLQAPLQTRGPFPKGGEHSRIGIFLCDSPHHASSVPLVLSTQTGLVSPQFHCVFDDDFDTVGKEQANTSIWKTKAHLQEAKEKSDGKHHLVIARFHPKIQPATSLPPYSRDIPQALKDLSQLLPDAPATEDDSQPEEPSAPPTKEPTSQVENPDAQDPAQVQVEHHQQEAPSNDSPVVIVPSGYT